MTQTDALHRELNFLGVDDTTVEVLALLPLIQVAWADGEVQEGERSTILEIARERYHLGEDGAALLEGWLSHPPSPAYLERGRRMLLALAHQRDDFDLQPEHLEDVVAFSKQVAQAAGGFLGFRSVDASEAEALEDIATALRIGHERAVGLTHFDEDVEDESTDVRSSEDMSELRNTLADSADFDPAVGRLADLLHHGPSGITAFAVPRAGLTIGRSRANSVQVRQDGEISRLHCRVVVEDGRLYVVDNQTTNGTWVNGERVTRRRLFGDEEIRAGHARFTYVARPG